MRVLVIVLAAICFAASPAFAEDWHVGAAPSDDPEMPAATISNEDGAVLYMWSRHVDNRFQVFAEFHLAEGQSFGDDMPLYWIDGSPPVDTDEIRREGDEAGTVWGHVGDTVALWLVWTSIQDKVLPSDRLHDWFTGQELVISYKDAEGNAHTARFALAGSKPAILAATELKSQ
ncbi:MAG: hypothetical protein ACREEE_15200 [Dongiaceae bacterium]